MRPPLRTRRFAAWSRPPARNLQLESLEDRILLSGKALPGAIVFVPSRGVRPFVAAGPVGYMPAQIRQAYGMDQITLPDGFTADGEGMTLAIVDAFDDPNIANDLRQFD